MQPLWVLLQFAASRSRRVSRPWSLRGARVWCLFFCLCVGRRGKPLSQASAEHPASAAVRKPPAGPRVSVASVSPERSRGAGALTVMGSAAQRPALGHRRCRRGWCGWCLGSWQQALVRELPALLSKTGFFSPASFA